MNINNKKESFVLFVGDLLLFTLALWLSLTVRNLQIPDLNLFSLNFLPFSFLFVIWIFSFFIAGLYEKQTLITTRRIPYVIFNTQVINSLVAIVFFYFIPYFLVTPKTILFIDLIITFALLISWRTVGKDLLFRKRKQHALLVGSGKEVEDLVHEIKNNPRYGITLDVFAHAGLIKNAAGDDIKSLIHDKNARLVIADLESSEVSPVLSNLYELIFSNVLFVNIYDMYEEVFERIPFALLRYNWFLENISMAPKFAYDFFKRTFDLVASIIGGTISLIFYPFTMLAIMIEDGRPIFLFQERIGQGGKIIKLIKFRSMKTSDGGIWVKEGDDRITKVGKIIRKTRIDELPQFWNVLRGDVSLIGPRADIKDLGMKLSTEIPYYNIRTLIKPGLSGWAQIKQKLPPQSLEETKMRLAYDIYYIKNRSFLLDVKISLKTIKTLLSRTGL